MPDHTKAVALLRSAIKASGLSARAFAVQVLIRDERTCRRWLAGDSPIPKAVLRFLGADNASHHRAAQRAPVE